MKNILNFYDSVTLPNKREVGGGNYVCLVCQMALRNASHRRLVKKWISRHVKEEVIFDGSKTLYRREQRKNVRGAFSS